ncbi:MAG: ABC transporter substrate-binding protein [Burkholderiales bacterium]|nr:ABC transporter substrate-binding protein [Burkholderiales bacterium]
MDQRRKFLAAGGAMLLGAPVFTRRSEAQRLDRVYRIGLVSPTAPGPRNDALLDGLRDLGYVQGHNIVVEQRFAGGQPERLPGLIEEVIRLNVDVLVVGATIGAAAAKRATTTIPVVFAGSSDPVTGGIVKDLAHPEGNITGFSLAYGDGFARKWLQLLKEVVPNLSHVALLWSSSNPAAQRFVSELEVAAQISRVTLFAQHARNLAELDAAFVAIGSARARGLIVTPSPFAATNQSKLIQFAASKRLPAIYFADDFVDAGGLMSYGPSIADTYRRSATYVDKILKGAKPRELPVQQPTKFELVINRKTAHSLGIVIPQSVLLRADRVIE